MIHPTIGFVILNYFSSNDVLKLISQIQEKFKEQSITIMVVDNSVPSDKDLIANLPKEPNIHTIINEANLGYAQGNNIGIAASQKYGADYIFVFNPDVLIKDIDIQGVLSSLKEDTNHNVFSIPISGVAEYSERPNLFSLIFPIFRRMRDLKTTVKAGQSVYRFHGCAFCIKAPLLKKFTNAFFDEDTFLYWEEDIIALDLLEQGEKVGYLKDIEILHEASSTVNFHIPYKKYKYMYQSLFI